jgi:hypothetical protein
MAEEMAEEMAFFNSSTNSKCYRYGESKQKQQLSQCLLLYPYAHPKTSSDNNPSGSCQSHESRRDSWLQATLKGCLETSNKTGTLGHSQFCVWSWHVGWWPSMVEFWLHWARACFCFSNRVSW